VASDIDRDVVCQYETLAPGMIRYATALSESADSAQDALQEAFLRYYIARGEGCRIRNPKAWLYRVLRNLLVDSMRCSTRECEVTLEDAPAPPDSAADPEAQCRQTELRARLRSLLAPRELECMKMRAEGLRYEEIAEVLEISPGTVGALLARAHKKVREALADRTRGTMLCTLIL
jgi:RNA polymerase sigma-70 factor (ECF subfamily)